MNNKITTFFIILMLGISSIAKGQVTIGVGLEPVKGALLDMKTQEADPTTNVTSTNGGLLLPRVYLTSKTDLFPMFEDDGSNGYKIGSTLYNKADEDKRHTGLFVYNMNDNPLCLGLNQWDGKEWNCFQSKIGNALFRPVSCSDIAEFGTYVKEKPVTSENYLQINLYVTKIGAFTVGATTGNGYSFYLSGVALEIGPMTINVPSQGKPVAAQTDLLLFTGIELATGCAPEITVKESIAAYTMLCSTVEVQGQYYKGETLTSSHGIKMTVNVSAPGSYTIYTETKNGVKFMASGEFTSAHISAPQSITLTGTGSPTINQDFPVTIKSNSSLGSAECSTVIPIILPAMTYAIIGDNVWSWNEYARTHALSDPNSRSFSPTGTVKIRSFTKLWDTTNAATATTRLNSGFNGKHPDVVLYFAYDCNPTTDLSNALAAYVNKGGCVIYGSSDDTAPQVNILMEGIFGTGTRPAENQTGGGSDNVYQIKNDSSDPIVNGPFGNLSGMYWGEDNTSNNSIVMSYMPANSVQICSAQSTSKPGISPTLSIVWYNSSKNFVYFGDSTGAHQTNTSNDAYPTIYDINGIPKSKFYGPGTTSEKRYVFNSALEFNAVAALLKRAAVSGINPH